MLNNQPIEVRNLQADGTLEIHSIFYTIQGEGPFSGFPAIFIRLAGCNLQCPGCDTDYTSKRQRMSVAEIYSYVTHLRLTLNICPVIVITGGEPFRQNLEPLVKELAPMFYTVQIETNGTLEIPPYVAAWATVVCSPKTSKLHRNNEDRIDYFKYVLSANSVSEVDGLPLLALNHSNNGQVARPYKQFPKERIYVQPMDEKDDALNAANTKAVTTTVLKYGYVLQLQIHKHIGVE